MASPRNVVRSVTSYFSGALLQFVAALILAHLLALAATADEPSQDVRFAPLADSLVTKTSWDGQTIGNQTTASDEEASLAARVAALERYIHEQQLVTAAAEEPLPPGETDAPKDSCKELEPIIKPTFTPTGRIYFDGVTYDDDPATAAFFGTDRENELGFRTFRIGGKGNIYENLIYSIEFEIRGTNSAITYKDIYMEWQSLPGIGHFRAGHFKEPIGLEEFGSDLFVTFMEKSPATQAFTLGRNFGVMMWNHLDEWDDATWFLGAFRADSPDSPTNTGLWRSDNDDWSYDARLAWLPYYDEPSNGRYLVHLGGSYSFRHIGGTTPTATINQNVPYTTLNGLAEFTTRGWVGSQGPIGIGAEADSDQWNQLNAEFLAISGPLSVQSEYFQVLMTSGEQYNGAYAFVSYFLTGENRAYRRDLKVIDRTMPFEPAFWVETCTGACCGRGAWELAAGYSFVNLEDGHDITAAKQRAFIQEIVVGVNWYHNPWSRVYFDYEHEIIDYVDGGVPDSNANIFGIRWQIDW